MRCPCILDLDARVVHYVTTLTKVQVLPHTRGLVVWGGDQSPVPGHAWASITSPMMALSPLLPVPLPTLSFLSLVLRKYSIPSA
jgi:hypothetical protein